MSSSVSSPYSLGFLVVGLAWAFWILLPKYVRWRSRVAMLNVIPTVGPTGFLSGFVGTYRFFTNAKDILQEGYEKYPNRIFKVALVDRWAIIAPGRMMVEDLMKATDDQLSMIEAAAETLQVEYTLSKEVVLHPYHVAIVRTPMTRNIATRFAEVRDETVSAFADLIPAKDDWVKVPAYKTSFQIVGRTANRFFVGLPLCRDSDWLDLNTNFAVEVFISAMIINLFPSFLKPIAGHLLTRMPSSMKRATKHLAPIIEERLAREDEYGTKDWPSKPNDLISWLLDEAKAEQREVSDLITRILAIEVAAIHTTSTAFCNALYQLAAHPELVVPLREEVEAIVEESGWTKEGVGKMRKLDSFLKETLRFSGGGGIVNNRKVLTDFTFSDGTTVPAGTTIGVAAYMHHHDEAQYDNPYTFDAFRFYNMRNREGESIKHQTISPGPDYITFGNGRHACPGRFFAVYEIKGLIAHILMSYDVKLETEGVIPPYEWHGPSMDPSSTGEVLFRKRR
ncbi:cytochrome P450 [Lentinula edodes]|uniref:cytochrome P450 n=1 Tax=Lentinula edodes TaxID=5353 RepID=UPI001E8CEBD0|nr:cytochrome P450 [Lentinula edodes]KAH7867756.1 cytochrome P450 [Lentinula edodes]